MNAPIYKQRQAEGIAASESKGGKVRQTTITNPTKLLSDAQRLAGRENHNRRSC